MRVEVEGGEEDRERFLNTEKAVERPFTMELNNGLVGNYALIRNDVLAGIVAF